MTKEKNNQLPIAKKKKKNDGRNSVYPEEIHPHTDTFYETVGIFETK